MNGRARLFTDWLLLAGFCGFLFFFGLAYFGLVGADEPRYAQVAREMLERHDWITPTLAGKPWLEKPVLYYWQAMLAYRIFGVSDWAARLPSALDATLMVLAVYFFLRRFRPGFQLDGALMTASAAGIVGFARAASMEMALTTALSIALLAWYAWHETGSKFYLGWFYICLGLGTLAKGPVAPILAAAILMAFAAAKGDYRLIGQTLWIPGAGVFCAVTLPWYMAVQWKNPEFFRIFVLQHNLLRFSTNLYHHAEPVWYFVPIALFGLVPWTIFTAVAFTENIRGWWKAGRRYLAENGLHVFLMIWLVAPVVFFSASRSKLPGYIVPALPAGTLLLAEYARRHSAQEERRDLVLIILHAVGATLFVIPAMMLQYIVFQHRLPLNRGFVIAAGFATVLAAGMIVTLRGQLGVRALRFVTLVPVVLTVAAALRLGAPALDATLSARPLAAQIGQVESKRLPLAVSRVSRETEFGLEFYRNQKIVRYEEDGVPAEEHLLVTPEGFQSRVEKRTAGRRAAYLGSFAAQGLDYYWVSAAGTAEEVRH